jgi:chromosome segregation ATPase
MSNEKYLSYYVEILTGTMTDAVIRNISLQSNAKISEDVINDLSNQIDNLKNEIDNLKNEINSVEAGKHQSENSKIINLENVIKGHLDTINHLTSQSVELNKMRDEYEKVKHQVQHVDTFRNELIKEREEHQKTRQQYELTINQLNEKIEYLQLTPAKRKKIEEEKNKTIEVLEPTSVLPLTDNTIKDGGSF